MQEELQEAVEASALADEVVGVEEAFQEVGVVALLREAGAEQEVAFLADAVDSLSRSLVCVDISAFWRMSMAKQVLRAT